MKTLLTFVGLLFLAASLGMAADQLTRFDFEDGTLQGWKIVSGQAGSLPTGPDAARPDQKFGQQGKYFIGLHENPERDAAVVVLQSPTFTLGSNRVSLLVGGGNHRNQCYVALYRASDNSEIARETGIDGEMMVRRYWDVGEHRNEQVYLKIVDSHTGGWGHLNVDDIRELTPAEERLHAREVADKAKRYDRWLAGVDAPSKQIVYTGSALADIAFPLGGIGGGHVSICGDGAIRQWCIFNKVNEACVVPNSFFAIRAETASRPPVVRLLQKTPIGDLPAVKDVAFVGEYPVAELKFTDPALPVKVSLRAYSPFIPMNSRDSAIPAAVFEFTVQNRSGYTVKVSLLSTLQNAVGYDGVSKIDGVSSKYFGGNANLAFGDGRLHGVQLSNPSLQPDARQFGTMAIAARHDNAVLVEQWDDLPGLWTAFSRYGVGVSQSGAPSGRGRTWNAAVAVPITLEPGQKATVPFVWAWHFPNHYNWWSNREGQPKLGRMYSNWFEDASKVAAYTSTNFDRLSTETERFRQAFYKTTLPYWMLDRISAQSSTLVSTVCMWLEDGNFVAFEGAGCCPMNCTHVWDYEQQLAHLFPDLERNMRRIDLEVQQMPDGGVRHRTRLPVTLPRDTNPFCDGHLGTILKAYRDYRQSVDRSWLDRMWPRIKLAMEYGIKEYDPNKDGVIVAAQWNTYDAAMYGPNTFIGTLYLGALRACEEMAKIQGDDAFAKQCRAVFDSGGKRLDETLWTGEYWRQIETKPVGGVSDADRGHPSGSDTPPTTGGKEWLLEDWPEESKDANVNRPYGKGCHADQLLGQWWATQLDLGYLLPKEHVQTALDSIMKFNWVPDFGKVKQTPRAFAGEDDPGLYICTWPYGGKPPVETLYSFEVWTGIEYEVAGLMIQEGKVHEAYQIVKAASDRYNGVRRAPIERNPWAEVECSNHYARAMASWGMLLAAQGYRYSGPDQSIGFDPVVSPKNHTSFFTGAEGWGLFTQKRDRASQLNTLGVEYGKLDVKSLRLRLPDSAAAACADGSVKIVIDASYGSFTPAFDGTSATIAFAQPVTVKSGEKMHVAFRW